MFAYGLSAPPRFPTGDTVTEVGSTATTAFPALSSGEAWTYMMISSSRVTGDTWFDCGDATANIGATPKLMFNIASGPIILNITGCTHYDLLNGGSDTTLITPIDRPRGNGSMLNSPPAFGSSTFADTTSAGSQAIPQTLSIPTKYLMISSNSAVAMAIAVGGSGVTAANDAQLYININSGPTVINVSGMTTIAWSATGGGFMALCPLAF